MEKEIFYQKVYEATEFICDYDYNTLSSLHWNQDVLHVTLNIDKDITPLQLKDKIYTHLDHCCDPCMVCNYFSFDIQLKINNKELIK